MQKHFRMVSILVVGCLFILSSCDRINYVVLEQPGTISAEIRAQQPRVVEVSYYSDLQLSTPIAATQTISTGDRIYTKVVFSEPMRQTIAENKNARPNLSFLINAEKTRYHVVAATTSASDFTHGACKPFGSSTDVYICHVVIPEGISGTFTTQIDAYTNTDVKGFLITDLDALQIPEIQIVP